MMIIQWKKHVVVQNSLPPIICNNKHWKSILSLYYYLIRILFPPIRNFMLFLKPLFPDQNQISWFQFGTLSRLIISPFDLIASFLLNFATFLKAYSSLLCSAFMHFEVTTSFKSGVITPNSISIGNKGCQP